ncbi:baseplate J-like protein [Selenomonas sp. FOBRC9]|uniref:baseplate J/gp47 family protein n=1 Tax=Selenomonas sp. FOBRC9 TaxID=936573 RepID=UPI00027A632D|nr:baseplate J/gp47 family protein [Selenomonas sp. FOBRC9]EJP32336.1 baseplate J-like protein [Selenomonas sp. FOBRC9]
MAYFAPYIDDAGLHVPTYADIRDDLIAQFKKIYGEDIYLGNDAQDYQMISAFALKTYDTMQMLQIVYHNQSAKTAVGTGLSSRVKLNGLRRKTATHSTCVLTLTGVPGTTIPAGIVEDTQGRKWELPEKIRFEGETLETTAQCQDVGAVEAPVGTITKISNPQYGWLSVTNKVPAVKGRPIETDEELRKRQSISTAIPSQNMVDSTIAGIASVAGVTRYKVYENDTNSTDENGVPGHSIAAVVEGGLDSAVAEQIYLRKGPGCGTHGTTTTIYVNSDGLKNEIRFFRPIYQEVAVKVTIKKYAIFVTTVEDDINRNITEYIERLGIGTNVTTTGILTAISAAVDDALHPPFALQSVQLGRAGGTLGIVDIIIPYNAIAKSSAVTVEVV